MSESIARFPASLSALFIACSCMHTNIACLLHAEHQFQNMGSSSLFWTPPDRAVGKAILGHVGYPVRLHVEDVLKWQQRGRDKQVEEAFAGMCTHLPKARPPLRDPDREGGVCADCARGQCSKNWTALVRQHACIQACNLIES